MPLFLLPYSLLGLWPTSYAAGMMPPYGAQGELRRISLPRTPVNKGKKGRGPGCYQFRPSPLLDSVLGAYSFLALLLLASQEVVRDPPYGVRDSAYRSSRGYFEE